MTDALSGERLIMTAAIQPQPDVELAGIFDSLAGVLLTETTVGTALVTMTVAQPIVASATEGEADRGSHAAL